MESIQKKYIDYMLRNKFNHIIAITVDCGIPIQPVNGILGSYSNTKERANVTFQCNEEFVPSIIRTSTCSSLGMWSPPPDSHNCTLIKGKIVTLPPYIFNHHSIQHQ